VLPSRFDGGARNYAQVRKGFLHDVAEPNAGAALILDQKAVLFGCLFTQTHGARARSPPSSFCLKMIAANLVQAHPLFRG
jgi:hypothetical protein